MPPTRLQRWGRRVRRKPGWEVALIFDLLVVGFAVWGVLAGLHEQAEYDALDSRGKTAVATVVDVTEHWGRVPSHHVYVAFDTPAGPVRHAETAPLTGPLAVQNPGTGPWSGTTRGTRPAMSATCASSQRRRFLAGGFGGPLLGAWVLWGFHRRNGRST